MTTMAFDAHRGADPAFTPGQDRNVLLLLLQTYPYSLGFCRSCRNRVGTVVGTVVGIVVKNSTERIANLKEEKL